MLTAPLELDQLGAPVSADSASGENLAYTERYLQMERLAQGRAEQQYGDAVYDAEEPDWEELEKLAMELAASTHDLRVGVYLTLGLLRTNGLEGFADGLNLLATWLGNEWETLHPELDPDDGLEAIERSNIMLELCDVERTLSTLARVPLVEHPVLGPCDLYQLRIARSDSRGSTQDDHLPLHVIREMFQTSETADLIATQLHARRAEQLVDQIVDIFQDHTGTSPNMSPLADMMREIHASIEEMMPDKTSSQPKTTSAPVVRPLEDSAPELPPPTREGQRVKSRRDVLAMLDELCDYYHRNEPSSPVPLLLQRSRQLVEMDFVDIVRNLAPDGLADVSRWVGVPSSRDDH
ncbi:MAG: type VI secretion system protein TssA [Planctomycetaceae bacterium]